MAWNYYYCYYFCSCLLFFYSILCNSQLTGKFYDRSCPSFKTTVKSTVDDAVANDPRMGASLLRLHFHDCFVQGCDGSVLLDDPAGEKQSVHNAGSLRGFEVIDSIKDQVESMCPGVVSCADILALAAKDSVVALGGPSWSVRLGRRDGTTRTTSQAADNEIPFSVSNLSDLIGLFSRKGFTLQDLVALSGAHTIGQARCARFRDHIYQDRNINPSFAQSLQMICPFNSGDDNLAPMDARSPTVFDNNYYVDLINFMGLIHSDQELFNGGSTDSLVQTYGTNQPRFFRDFASAMVKMGNLGVLTGSDGVVRSNCRVLG